MWNHAEGRLGYEIGAKHTIGVVALTSLKRQDMGIHTIYSGKSLGRLEEMYGDNGIDVLKYHVGVGHNIARLDVALDFVNHGISVETFVQSWYANNCKTTLKSANIVKSLDSDDYTLYIGSQKRRKKLVRVYNKAAELGISGNWVRVEAQIMGKPATTAGIELSHSSDTRKAMLSVLRGIVDFTDVKVWNKVFEDVESVKVGSQSTQKGDTRDWLINQVIPSLAKEIVLDSAFWVQFNMFVARETNRLMSS